MRNQAIVLALDDSSSMVWEDDDSVPSRWREIVECSKSFIKKCREHMHGSTKLNIFKYSKDIDVG